MIKFFFKRHFSIIYIKRQLKVRLPKGNNPLTWRWHSLLYMLVVLLCTTMCDTLHETVLLWSIMGRFVLHECLIPKLAILAQSEKWFQGKNSVLTSLIEQNLKLINCHPSLGQHLMTLSWIFGKKLKFCGLYNFCIRSIFSLVRIILPLFNLSKIIFIILNSSPMYNDCMKWFTANLHWLFCL